MAVEQTRAQVIDLSRPAALEVEIEVSEAAEVLMSICAVGDRGDYDTLDLDSAWLEARREQVPADLLAAVDEVLPGATKVPAHLLGIVLESPRPRTFASFLAQLEETDAVEVKLHLFGAFGSSFSHLAGPDVIQRAARGDAEAQELFLEALAEYSDKHELVRNLLELGADEVKARLLDVLPRWYEHVFVPTADEWREAAERDAESKRALAARHSPEQLVELAARGYQYAPGPGIRTLALFPSWWMRPWVVLWEHKGTKVFCYPIAAPPEEEASPAEVARVYKALGDAGRLKLLRRLSDGPLTLTEAAAELGVAKSTAHHHLAILRQAGFVAVRAEEDNVYSLRRDLPQAGELLGSYLGGGSSRSSATSA